ncbi:hypothetical protein IQ07DRAFT_76713 [Pyrenochaeta sp. DS3sAY3a]|nr:hypothetical protein IQ07DRAFT_76713 [Pyrenochaeta sp. DS3sAY3a]
MAQNNQPTQVPAGGGHQARNQGGRSTGRRGRYASTGHGGYYGSNNRRGHSRAQESAESDLTPAPGIRFGGPPVPTPLSDAGVYMGFGALNASINSIRDDGTKSESAAGAISQQITPASTRSATPSSTDGDLKYKRMSMTNDSVAQRAADLAANIAVSTEPLHYDNSTPEVLRVPSGVLDTNSTMLADLADSMGLMPSTTDPTDPRFLKDDTRLLTKQSKTALFNDICTAMTALRTKQKHAVTAHKRLTTDMLTLYAREVAAESDAATHRDAFIALAPAAFAGSDDAKTAALAALVAANEASKLGAQLRAGVEDMRNTLGAIERGFMVAVNEYEGVLCGAVCALIRGAAEEGEGEDEDGGGEGKAEEE